MAGLFYMLAPMLLHMAVSETAAALLGGELPQAGIVLAASLLVLPPAVWMALRDNRGQVPCGWRTDESGWSCAGADRAFLRGRPFAQAGACVLSAAAGAGMNVLISDLIRNSILSQWFPDTVQETLMGHDLLLAAAALGIAVPAAEELIFRGLMYRRMRLRFSAATAILLNVLLFAGYHGNVIQFVFAVPMGLLLCVLYEKSRWLLLPVLFHAGSNLAAVLWNYKL